jgi:hypothetical protein
MRQAKRQNPGKVQVSRPYSLPAPTGGWDAVSPIAAMSADRAVILDNFVCRPGLVELRRGYAQRVGGFPAPVQSLMVYRGLATGDRLLAAAGANIYDATVSPLGAPLFSTATSAVWQYVNFATLAGTPVLVACNGSDTPITYNGTAVAPISFTGSSGGYSLNPAKLSAVAAYQGRLFFIESGTLHVWYPGAAAIAGTLSLLDLGSVFDKGGRLISLGTWSVNYDASTSEYIAFLTDQGQVAIYQGTDPNQSALWALVGVFDLGLPLGPRALVKYGADLVVLTADGAVPLSQALTLDRSQDDLMALTQRIQNAFAAAVRAYRGNFGWEAILYSGGVETSTSNTEEGGGSLILVNVPVAQLGTSQQYVQNVQTGAWSRFLNLPAFCWAVANQKIYFGSTATVCQWDVGADDNGAQIVGEVLGAYNACGARAQSKLFTMIRPLLYASPLVQPALDINVDYQQLTPTAVPVIVDPYSTTPETRYDWTSVGATGYVGAPHMVVSIASDITVEEVAVGDGSVLGVGDGTALLTMPVVPYDVPLQLIGFDVIYQTGGPL